MHRLIPMLWLALLASGPTAWAHAGQPAAPSTDVVGVTRAQLAPEYWIARLTQPDRPVLDRDDIARHNQRLRRLEPSVHDMAQLPAALPGGQIRQWLDRLSSAPTRALYDEHGDEIGTDRLGLLQQAIDRDAIADGVAPRFGLTVHRADLRAFPTRQRVFRSPDDTDIDRFQESALFPGTPVAIVHESLDGQWSLVISPNYIGWLEKRWVAEGDRDEVLAYVDRSPYLVVTGATTRTVFTPEQPALSSLQLDMGTRVPLLPDWPPGQPVNGQNPYSSHIVQLPFRDANGRLLLRPALVPIIADAATEHLPYTPANVLLQAFKFLGERYGWGHAYGGRDCSGFVSEIYRSMGIELPRNTSSQARSPALNHTAFEAGDTRESRMAALDTLEVGDLIFIPGHVMMMIGRVDGAPYVIHDTAGGAYLDAEGRLQPLHLNAVAVTPLLPLHLNDEDSYVDRITSIVRIRP